MPPRGGEASSDHANGNDGCHGDTDAHAVPCRQPHLGAKPVGPGQHGPEDEDAGHKDQSRPSGRVNGMGELRAGRGTVDGKKLSYWNEHGGQGQHQSRDQTQARRADHHGRKRHDRQREQPSAALGDDSKL
jgi:hypothetical protein